MKIATKKIMSLLLCLIISVCFSLQVVAATNPYGKYQTIDGVTTVRCTWYAWEQAYSNTGAIMPNFGNAKNWYTSAQNNGFAVGSTPKAKSIAVWTDSGYGHVGYVVSVNGSKITVNEGGMLDTNGQAYNGTGILNGSVCNSAVGSKKSNYSSKILVGYIYLTENNSVGGTVTLKSASDKNTISSNNAVIWGRVDKPSDYAVTKIGIKVRENDSTYDKGWEKYESPSQSYVGKTYMYPYYDLKAELGANLIHATKYFYRFYAVVNDKEYWSDEYDFTTTGTHSYTAERAEAKYLKSEATCKSKAVYYKSCSGCEAKSTNTFEYGSVSSNHTGGTHIEGNRDVTYDKSGYTGDTVCNTCGKILEFGYNTYMPTLVKENGVWYYVVDGKKVSDTTLVKYYDTWYYVESGKVNFNATTLFKYSGIWYYVEKGKVNFNATTLCKYGGTWYYVERGKVNWNAVTLCKYYDVWYYAEKGKVNFNATTLCKYGDTWYYVEKGKVNFNATTLCKYGNTWYYVEKGKVNFKANLRFNYYGKYYNVRNGVVRF